MSETGGGTAVPTSDEERLFLPFNLLFKEVLKVTREASCLTSEGRDQAPPIGSVKSGKEDSQCHLLRLETCHSHIG